VNHTRVVDSAGKSLSSSTTSSEAILRDPRGVDHSLVGAARGAIRADYSAHAPTLWHWEYVDPDHQRARVDSVEPRQGDFSPNGCRARAPR